MWRMRAWLLALVASGCGFSSSAFDDSPDAAVDSPDAAVDQPPLGDVAPICGGTFHRVCVAPPSPLTLLTRTIDTSQRTAPCVAYTTTPAIDACVIAGESITIPGNHTITVIGTRPLILFATGSITLSGLLDASSHREATGPGADPAG